MAIETILLIEDDPSGRLAVRSFLESDGYEVSAVASCAAVDCELETVRPHAAILDYQLPDGDALDLLPRLRKADPEMPVIILTAHGSVEIAVEAMRRGANHFLTKPVALRELQKILEQCLEDQRAHRRRQGYDTNRYRRRPDPFRGSSTLLGALERLSRKVAGTARPVLLAGETGCGKGVLAHWLHDNGPRAEEPFIDLNCAGLKPEFLESELFGHAKGAFTGATETKPGLLEIADRGTLFLDEIGDMDLAIQAKLLKVVEEQTFRRLGEVRERRVDVRLLAATNRDLAKLAHQGGFRSDLYFRLNTFKLEIPPLRHRRQDISTLAEHFLGQLSREVGRPGIALADGALDALVRYRWPGNIRELRNLLEHAVLLGDGDILEPGDLYFEADAPCAADSLNLSLEELERVHIARVLVHEKGSVSRTAKSLGIQRNTLYQKIKKYDIERPSR